MNSLRLLQRSSAHLSLLAPLALLLGACSDDTGSGASAQGGSGGSGGSGGEVAGGGNAGGAGGGTQVDPVEAAVRAHDWVKLDGAPSVGGGAKQDDIFFVNSSTGFVASGPNEAIFSTDDAGATWQELFTSPGTYFRAVLFTSEMHGFAGNIGSGLAPSISDDTLVYETLDGGATWDPVTTITGSAAKGICNFSAVDENNIFGIGRANGPAHLLQTTDGGATWVAKSLASKFSMAIDGRFTSPTEGLVIGMSNVGQKCTIGKTTDGGDSFETVFTSKTPGSLCWKMHFPSDLIGYVAVQDTTSGPGTIAKTTDGGATWAELPLPVDGDAYSGIGIGFITDTIGWVAAEDASSPVFRTFDGGATWEEDPALKAPINRFRFIDANTAYAVGGSVWKLDLTGGQ